MDVLGPVHALTRGWKHDWKSAEERLSSNIEEYFDPPTTGKKIKRYGQSESSGIILQR